MKLSNFRLDYEPLSGDHIQTVVRTLKDIKRERLTALTTKPTWIEPMVKAMAEGIYLVYHGLYVVLGVVAAWVDYWLHKWAYGK